MNLFQFTETLQICWGEWWIVFDANIYEFEYRLFSYTQCKTVKMAFFRYVVLEACLPKLLYYAKKKWIGEYVCNVTAFLNIYILSLQVRTITFHIFKEKCYWWRRLINLHSHFCKLPNTHIWIRFRVFSLPPFYYCRKAIKHRMASAQNGVTVLRSILSIFFSLGQHFWGRTNSDGCVVKVILSIPAE